MAKQDRGLQREYGTPHPMRPAMMQVNTEVAHTADTGLTVTWPGSTRIVDVKIPSPAGSIQQFANRPRPLGAPVTDGGLGIASAATGTNQGTFTRTVGSWVEDGIIIGDCVSAEGYGDDADDVWVVAGVTATVLTVADPEDKIPANTAANGQSITKVGKAPITLGFDSSMGAVLVQPGLYRVDVYCDVTNSDTTEHPFVMAVTDSDASTVYREGPTVTIRRGSSLTYVMTAICDVEAAEYITLRAIQNDTGTASCDINSSAPAYTITKIANADEGSVNAAGSVAGPTYV